MMAIWESTGFCPLSRALYVPRFKFLGPIAMNWISRTGMAIDWLIDYLIDGSVDWLIYWLGREVTFLTSVTLRSKIFPSIKLVIQTDFEKMFKDTKFVNDSWRFTPVTLKSIWVCTMNEVGRPNTFGEDIRNPSIHLFLLSALETQDCCLGSNRVMYLS